MPPPVDPNNRASFPVLPWHEVPPSEGPRKTSSGTQPAAPPSIGMSTFRLRSSPPTSTWLSRLFDPFSINSLFSSGPTFADLKVAVIYNPEARDGKNQTLVKEVKEVWEQAGAKVFLIETVENIHERHTEIARELYRILGEGPVVVVSLGGDGTLQDVAMGLVKTFGVSLKPGEAKPHRVADLRNGASVVPPKFAATAGDIGALFGTPSRVSDFPSFLHRSLPVPYTPLVIGTPDGKGGYDYRLSLHSDGHGVGGHLFQKRQEIREWVNKSDIPLLKKVFGGGVASFFLLIPDALKNRYGLQGFEAHIEHYDREGHLKEKPYRVWAAEALVTPSRIIAWAAGIPGAWGEAKLMLLPPAGRFLHGVFSLLEFLGRGAATKLGWNWVGPEERLRTLSRRRQVSLKPGESVKIAFYERPYWLFAKKAPQEIQPPTINDGDVVKPTKEFTVHMPEKPLFTIPGDPQSVAVQSLRATALAQGTTPILSDQQIMAKMVTNPDPKVFENSSKERVLVRTPFLSATRLRHFMEQKQIPHELMTDLLVHRWGVEGRQELVRLANEASTVEGIQEYFESSAGQEWLQRYQGRTSGIGRRTVQIGIPSAAGVGVIFGLEALLDQTSLHPVGDQALRFSAVTWGAHLVQDKVATPFFEVISNRLLRRPYDYVRTRSARVAGETFVQWTYGTRDPFWKAVGSSLSTHAIGAKAIGQSSGYRAFRGITMPVRAVGHMGPRLVLSRGVDFALQGMGVPEDSSWRRYGPTVAFFVGPDAARIVAPRQAAWVSQHWITRAAGAAASVGFGADLGTSGFYSWGYGEQAAYQLTVNHRVAQLREAKGEVGFVSKAVRFFAPTLADHIDSHDGLFGGDLEARREILEQDRQIIPTLELALLHEVPSLLTTLDLSWEKGLGKKVRLNELEEAMKKHLQSTSVKTATQLQEAFSGHGLSLTQTKRHLAKIHLAGFQQTIAMVRSMETPGSEFLQSLFDEQGLLRPGKGKELEVAVRALSPGVPMAVSSD